MKILRQLLTGLIAIALLVGASPAMAVSMPDCASMTMTMAAQAQPDNEMAKHHEGMPCKNTMPGCMDSTNCIGVIALFSNFVVVFPSIPGAKLVTLVSAGTPSIAVPPALPPPISIV